MAKKNIAELFVDTLVLAGVKRVYGVAGDSLNGITDVIRTDERIKWIHVRHEEAAAFAAGAEAHLTGSLAVCAGSCGPGNLHLINGLYDANRSRVPVLARSEIDKLFQAKGVQQLITSLKDREDGARVKILDAAFWMKGCSSLGRLRFAVLVGIGKKKKTEVCA